MCGEQHVPYDAWARDGGSPPRVRGTEKSKHCIFIQDRITPACAGNRALRLVAPGPLADHPRVCGEQDMLIGGLLDILGSPPRVRGTACKTKFTDAHFGITPACAGNRVSVVTSAPAI